MLDVLEVFKPWAVYHCKIFKVGEGTGKRKGAEVLVREKNQSVLKEIVLRKRRFEN